MNLEQWNDGQPSLEFQTRRLNLSPLSILIVLVQTACSLVEMLARNLLYGISSKISLNYMLPDINILTWNTKHISL